MERFGRPGRLCDLPETGEGENGVRGARVGERFRKEGVRKGPIIHKDPCREALRWNFFTHLDGTYVPCRSQG